MKRYFSILTAHLPWLAYALAGDLFFAVLLWFTDVSAFNALVLSIVLFSVLSFLLVCAIILASESRMTRALNEFLANPNEEHCQILLSNLKGAEMGRTKEMCDLLISREELLILCLNDFRNLIKCDRLFAFLGEYAEHTDTHQECNKSDFFHFFILLNVL